MFKDVGINTGGGGGISNRRYGYAVTFFDADWPGLSRMRIEQILKEEQQHAHIGTPAYFR